MTERTAPPGGPPGPAPPPGRRAAPEIQGDPFSALLDLHQARTATAEGTERRDRDSAPDDKDCAAPCVDGHVGDETVNVPETEVAEIAAPVATNVVVPVIDVVAEVALPQAGAALAPAAPVQPGEAPAPVAVAGAATPVVAAEPVQTAPAAPAAPAAQPAVTAEPGEPVVAPGATAPAAEQPVTGEAPAAAAQPVQQPGTARPGGQAQPQRADAQQPGQPQADQPAQTGVPAEGATGEGQSSEAQGDHGQARPQGDATPRPTAATPPAQPATPAAPAAQTQAAGPHTPGTHQVRAARLDQAVGSVEATIRLASQRGASHARISLSPAELGGIEIRLRSTSAGLVAAVVADSPEAAKLLQHAAGELRRSLEDQGLQVLRLDVGTTPDDRSPGAAGGGEREGSRADQSAGAPDEAEAGDPAETTVLLPNGVLVDVLA